MYNKRDPRLTYSNTELTFFGKLKIVDTPVPWTYINFVVSGSASTLLI